MERYDRVLAAAMARGQPVYSCAYIMPSGGKGAPCIRKHRMHLELLARMLRDGLPERMADLPTMAQAFAVLRSYPTIGDFLAYQYVTDINYSTLTNFSETEFVVPGPGALSGLRKCFADTGRLTDAEVIRLVQERQHECFASVGVTFPSLPGRALQLIDVQNLFCEVDKYARVAYPQIIGLDDRSRIKQRFQPSATAMLPLWYPPKWGINEKLDAPSRLMAVHSSLSVRIMGMNIPKLLPTFLLLLGVAASPLCAQDDSNKSLGEKTSEGVEKAKDSTVAETHKVADTTRHESHKVANTTRKESHKVANTTRKESHKVANTTRKESHKVANTTRHESHKVANTVRHETGQKSDTGSTDAGQKPDNATATPTPQ